MTSNKVPTGKLVGKIIARIFIISCGKCRNTRTRTASNQKEAKEYFESLGHKFTPRFGWLCPACQWNGEVKK